jgi:anaerobic magnesium-protoporphyrin IX monomethyl ester cyclase
MNRMGYNSKRGKVVLFYPTIQDLWQYVWFPFPYLYLAPFLEGAGFDVKIIDARIEPNWRDMLRKEIGDAICFGMTSMTGPDLANAMEACRAVRDTRPELPIVWGGHHARQVPNQILIEGFGDFVFRGQAEYGFVELVKLLERDQDPEGIAGLVYLLNGNVVGNTLAPIVDFGYNVFPAYHLLDIERYRSPNNIVAYFSSQGCPFHCTFCTASDFSYSYRSLDQVKEEINYLVTDLGFKSLFFKDGTFFVSKKRVLAIAELLLELWPEVKWKAGARANSLLEYSPKEMSMLRDSGLRSVFFGIESGSQQVLEGMSKKIVPEHAIRSAQLSVDYGFEFYASLMYATPGETLEDLKQTISLVRKIKEINPNATIQNCVYIPLPGTLMYEMAVSRGYQPPRTTKEWSRRDITSNFENRDDINWIKPSILAEYIRIYNNEFPSYRHVFEREKEGDYESPLKQAY